MSLPQVSILLTAYNREKFIGEAIESVLASSYEDFELIITDNCSSDNTVEISQSYAKHDARIRVYKNSLRRIFPLLLIVMQIMFHFFIGIN